MKTATKLEEGGIHLFLKDVLPKYVWDYMINRDEVVVNSPWMWFTVDQNAKFEVISEICFYILGFIQSMRYLHSGLGRDFRDRVLSFNNFHNFKRRWSTNIPRGLPKRSQKGMKKYTIQNVIDEMELPLQFKTEVLEILDKIRFSSFNIVFLLNLSIYVDNEPQRERAKQELFYRVLNILERGARRCKLEGDRKQRRNKRRLDDVEFPNFPGDIVRSSNTVYAAHFLTPTKKRKIHKFSREGDVSPLASPLHEKVVLEKDGERDKELTSHAATTVDRHVIEVDVEEVVERLEVNAEEELNRIHTLSKKAVDIDDEEVVVVKKEEEEVVVDGVLDDVDDEKDEVRTMSGDNTLIEEENVLATVIPDEKGEVSGEESEEKVLLSKSSNEKEKKQEERGEDRQDDVRTSLYFQILNLQEGLEDEEEEEEEEEKREDSDEDSIPLPMWVPTGDI